MEIFGDYKLRGIWPAFCGAMMLFADYYFKVSCFPYLRGPRFTNKNGTERLLNYPQSTFSWTFLLVFECSTMLADSNQALESTTRVSGWDMFVFDGSEELFLRV